MDLILKTVAENEKKRVEAEEKTRSEFAELRKVIESRLPVVEKKVEEMGSALETLSVKVELMEGSVVKQGGEQQGQSTPWLAGKRLPFSPNSIAQPDSETVMTFPSSSGGFVDLSASIPPMTCPQFDGNNPQMWKSNCEQYFDVYGIQPVHWVKVATLNFTGNAAFWLQSIRKQLVGITWQTLCELVCGRFTRDRQEALIRQWFHAQQRSSVTEYVEKFDSIMHQLMAYDQSLTPVYFVTKFIEGLRDDIRGVVMIQRPQDLDSACSIALLQEEILESIKPTGIKKVETTPGYRQVIRTFTPSNTTQARNSPVHVPDDKRASESAKLRDDRLASLKSYRRSKGLCFVCGERCSKEHKCATSIQLHIVQELLEALQADTVTDPAQNSEPEEEQSEIFMAISHQALWGTESATSFRLRGWVQGTELLLLVDSGSTHSFIDQRIGMKLNGITPLNKPVTVKLADGGLMQCTHEVLNCCWWMQGHKFKSNFKLLQLGSYDAILGMDWLSQFSPMHIDWVNKWMEFQHLNQSVKLLGISACTDKCPTISPDQLGGMINTGSVMLLIQLASVLQTSSNVIPESVQQVLQQFKSVFAEPKGLPPKRICDHSIPLIPGAKPVNLRPYRFNPALKDEIESQITEMLQSGVIQHSNSAFASPALLVRKKDGTWQLVIDYRQLNAITIKSSYPMPVIDELLDELSGAKWFSKLDLRAGYHQIRMKEGEEYKTAFQTHTGHYEYKVMSFGLTGAPATFQGAMNDTLHSVLRKFALVFFDDILVYSPDLPSHIDHLQQVLSLLQKHQWQVKLSKCSFAQKQLIYLGHIISGDGVSTDPSKVQEVMNWPVPTTPKKLRGFLGLAGYYRKFVKGFGIISKPLTQLLRKGVPFTWTTETDQAFNCLKHALVTAPVLALPDFSQPFTVETDASESGIGAVLSQNKHPIAFISKALGPRTKGLSTYEKECMAVLLAVEHWRSYLQLGEFTILTDHHSLMHLSDQRLHTPWQHKAFTKLLGLSYKIVYRKGTSNAAADALSRKFQGDSELSVVSSCTPTWLLEVAQGYESDAFSSELLAALSLKSDARTDYSLHDGIIKYKGRIWIGNNAALQSKLFSELHASPVGGHSGFPVTYSRFKRLFAWVGMKKQVKTWVQQCQICIQAKPDRDRYPGLLQPLPVPEGAWQVISLDFIEGLPKSHSYNCILVVVDKFSKYGHFLPLTHPFTAIDVAKLFMLNIFKLHGLPQTIISDRDRIFTSQLWEQLFTRSGTTLHLSTAYHPQTDGQTERVNQCLEIYLRCFVHATPSKWATWLHLAEYWYNTTFHSSLNSSPFEVLYGHPPRHFGINSEDCAIPDLHVWLQERKLMQSLVQQQLNRAQQTMKHMADKKRSFREFSLGDWVYVKLQPYVQSSVAVRANHKLAFKYFGPFRVVQLVGAVAYKLQLPPSSAIHPVFHVSQLKAAKGFPGHSAS